jgi:hypothetical protein
MSSRVVPAAASCLLAGLLDEGADLVEVARTRVSVHYETGRADVPVLCVCTPEAVRLPGSVVTPVVPGGRLRARYGALVGASATWRVGRWWQPPRPRGLTAPAVPPAAPGVRLLATVRPDDLVGAGPGLTPSGDDVLAGLLVAAHAVADPRLATWQAQTRAALRHRTTTAVSRGLLTHALDGWATPELAGFVTAVCAGDPGPALPALLAVGHTSGAALAAGALHVLGTSSALRGAA